MNIYLFFNNPCRLPVDGDKWNNWQDPDTTKLAWVCGESWRRAGWEVKRLSAYWLEQFQPFTGRLAESVKQYPFEYWNFWFQALRICRIHGPTWFTTIDVINFGNWRPQHARDAIDNLINPAPYCQVAAPLDIITLQRQHFSASALRLTEAGCKQAIDLVRRYDAGEFATIPIDLVSDETIVREYGTYSNLKVCGYPVEHDAFMQPLVHVTKSTLVRLFDSDANGAINQ